CTCTCAIRVDTINPFLTLVVRLSLWGSHSSRRIDLTWREGKRGTTPSARAPGAVIMAAPRAARPGTAGRVPVRLPGHRAAAHPARPAPDLRAGGAAVHGRRDGVDAAQSGAEPAERPGIEAAAGHGRAAVHGRGLHPGVNRATVWVDP